MEVGDSEVWAGVSGRMHSLSIVAGKAEEKLVLRKGAW